MRVACKHERARRTRHPERLLDLLAQHRGRASPRQRTERMGRSHARALVGVVGGAEGDKGGHEARS